ncbi:Cof-type HAD-IIB family hydrolase [Luteimicrobium subarcticum]|uniref:Cof subfamily protein (Haloacid dehalogenase superfamily)/HAD superfamily hydrolase (TIGR01484 family) n=1 Tax=Luteimicrobium subarcticum TaxID=620910 RepID=A0A2M8WV89_9MICO|nr:Cof-type HAD-IIB family hydrolase [Luteimicrobium subarcticum]PJI94806.1 hypothetical protein CLV34_0654 [Luteimicrobium subarcticum]
MTSLAPSRRRAVFLDVDGTYLSVHGVVPPSARDAVAQARAAGHLVFLCTGRSLPQITADVREPGFDGIVAGAGAYAELADGTVLRHVTYAPDELHHAAGVLERHGVEHLLETNTVLVGTPGAPRVLRGLIDASEGDSHREAFEAIVEAIRTDEPHDRTDVNKVIVLDSPVPLDTLRAELGDTFVIVPASVALMGPHSGEIQLRAVHKGAGVTAVLDHLGLDPADAVAFGDGANDVEMLELVGTGVAMGGSGASAVAAADLVTDRPEDDGIAHGFARLGLTTP